LATIHEALRKARGHCGQGKIFGLSATANRRMCREKSVKRQYFENCRVKDLSKGKVEVKIRNHIRTGKKYGRVNLFCIERRKGR
jgi:hypothetical protein